MMATRLTAAAALEELVMTDGGDGTLHSRWRRRRRRRQSLKPDAGGSGDVNVGGYGGSSHKFPMVTVAAATALASSH